MKHKLYCVKPNSKEAIPVLQSVESNHLHTHSRSVVRLKSLVYYTP